MIDTATDPRTGERRCHFWGGVMRCVNDNTVKKRAGITKVKKSAVEVGRSQPGWEDIDKVVDINPARTHYFLA